VCWLSDGPVPADLWRRLRAAHHRSGLWPLLVLDGVGDETFGWSAQEAAAVDRLDPATLLPAWWPGFSAGHFDRADRAALGHTTRWWQDWRRLSTAWPGTAPAGTPAADADGHADATATRLAAEASAATATATGVAGAAEGNSAVRGGGGVRVALVACARGADALAVAGWCPGDGDPYHPAAVAAVVRSWEDRFGARVIGVGRGSLELSVAAPPVTFAHAVRVAAEHVAFCPWAEYPAEYDYDSERSLFLQYAGCLVGRGSWHFWWT
jgi:hypothetical protein